MGASEWSALFAGVSAVIAVAAAIVAYVGPRSAAELAERLRKDNARLEQTVNIKRFVFFTLMQERAAPFTADAAKAFNIIDVVFHDNRVVREAWSLYLDGLDKNRLAPEAVTAERFRNLLSLISSDIGLADLNSADFERVYKPDFMMRILNVQSMQSQLQEKDLLKAIVGMSANTATESTSFNIVDK